MSPKRRATASIIIDDCGKRRYFRSLHDARSVHLALHSRHLTPSERTERAAKTGYRRGAAQGKSRKTEEQLKRKHDPDVLTRLTARRR